MKSRYKVMKSLASVIVITVMLVACGKDKGGGNGNPGYICDDYGCYQTGAGYQDPYGYQSPYGYPSNGNPNAPFTYPGQNPYGVSSSTVLLGGNISVSDRGAFKNLIDGGQNCPQNMILFTVSTCGIQASGTPYLQLAIYDYQFKAANSASPGTISLGSSTMMGQASNTTWKKTANGFAARATLPFQFGQAAQMTVLVTGRVTDSEVQVVLKYGSATVGSGTLYRLNK